MLPSQRSYSSQNYIDQLLLVDGASERNSERSSVDSPDPSQGSALLNNFVMFCITYSVAHATVDGVLAFSAAELGASIGSDGSAMLYFFYTFSSLLIARPAVRMLGAKRTVLFGLIGLLCYVSAFFIAVSGGGSSGIFLAGASIGGIGAGLLWTGQGSYYSINARAYAYVMLEPSGSASLANFASIFASSYLLFETLFKMFATIIYVAKDKEGAWKSIVFGIYVTAACISVFFFGFIVKNLKPRLQNQQNAPQEGINSTSPRDSNEIDRNRGAGNGDDEVIVVDMPNSMHSRAACSSSSPFRSSETSLWQDVFSVGKVLYSNRLLQLLMPYQVCFGLSAGFVNSYINAKVVAVFLGDGFIGLMSALATLTAVILAWPYAHIATTYKEHGKWYVMMTGGVCFLYSGLSVLCLSDAQMSSWPFLVSYFIIFGAARSAWESTNKAVVADYFGQDRGVSDDVDAERLKDSAFAAVYFMSGLAGAFGFVFYKFMSREQLAAINTVSPLLAILGYHYSHLSFSADNREALALREEEMLDSSATSSSSHRLAA